MCGLLDAGIVPYMLCNGQAQICKALCLGTYVLISARCVVSEDCAELIWNSKSRSSCIAGLHFTYPKDKRRAQEVKAKLLASHQHGAEGAPALAQDLQVALVFFASVLQSLHIISTSSPGLEELFRPSR